MRDERDGRSAKKHARKREERIVLGVVDHDLGYPVVLRSYSTSINISSSIMEEQKCTESTKTIIIGRPSTTRT